MLHTAPDYEMSYVVSLLWLVNFDPEIIKGILEGIKWKTVGTCLRLDGKEGRDSKR